MEKITLEEAKKQLQELNDGYIEVMAEFEGNALKPTALVPLYGKIRKLVKQENELLPRMRVSFREGSRERDETRVLYQEVNKTAMTAEQNMKATRDLFKILGGKK